MNNSFHLDATGVYRSTVLAQLPWLEHGFGTRLSANWLAERDISTVRQIHSDTALVLAAGAKGCVGEGDALITNLPGSLAAIKTADCLPVLIVDQVQHVVAAVHAGWRGTAADICGKTILRMTAEYGSKPKDLLVAVGPGIGACCFEVGPEVAKRFQDVFPERTDLDQRTKINLTEVNQRYLKRAGLSSHQIWSANLCTCCNATFESFRRDKNASGRMLSVVGVRDVEIAV